MPVVIQYVVERDGEAKMTFASKQQADAYDKMLDLGYFCPTPKNVKS